MRLSRSSMFAARTWPLFAAICIVAAGLAPSALSQEAPASTSQTPANPPAVDSAPTPPVEPNQPAPLAVEPQSPAAPTIDNTPPATAQPSMSPAQGLAQQTSPALSPSATDSTITAPASESPGAPANDDVPPAGNQSAGADQAPIDVPTAVGQNPATAAAAPASEDDRQDLPHDLSPLNMFLNADIIVKGVMILLAIASVLSWTIWFAKLAHLGFASGRLRREMSRLQRDASLAAAADRRQTSSDPLSLMVTAARDEVIRSDNGLLPADGIKERVTSHLARIEATAGRAMTSGTGLLATIGATAPFVGLFGTVWGIMNSFIGISKAQTTNLAVVAPGIAEALLATGIGLVAAIPAVIFYNQLARSISGYKAKLADGAAMVERLVSRDLDRQAARTPYLKAGE
ncbi:MULTISPECIES: tonB-system energizer ExbB [Filomicrobium]|nr:MULTISPECIES: tonB-system energizer ExbB [Filomicrobium]